MALPARLRINLEHLRQTFFSESCNIRGAHLYHAILAFRDDLPFETIYGDQGLWHDVSGKSTIKTPNHISKAVVATEKLSILDAPIWIDKEIGSSISIPTINMLPEVRRDLIEKPGTVAQGILFTNELDKNVGVRRERFMSLARDCAQCLSWLQSLLNLPILDDCDIRNQDVSSSSWLRTVHRLAWNDDRDPDSLLRAPRNTWIVGKNRSITFLPYEEEDLRAILKMPFFLDANQDIEVPASRFVSVLEHDVFTSSAYAITELIDIIDQQVGSRVSIKDLKPEVSERAIENRDKVVISYSNKDDSWLNDLTTMLSPAVKNNTVHVWYDKKIKPSQLWREEILSAFSTAKVGVLLVTKHYLNSDFITDHELPYLLSKAENNVVKILWVAVGQCLYEQTPLKEIQAVNNPAKPLETTRGHGRNAALKSVCQSIIEAFEGSSKAD